MLNLSLQTFIKYCHLNQFQLVSELDKKLNGKSKGHNFHWSLKKAIHSHIEGASQQEIDDILASPKRWNEYEAKYNREAFEKFIAKFGKCREIEVVNEERYYSIPKYELQLKVDPWFKTYEKGQGHLHLVWATQKPEILQSIANIGTLVLLDSFKGTQHGNAKFCFMDLVKPKRYSDSTISDKTHRVFEDYCRNISNTAKSV